MAFLTLSTDAGLTILAPVPLLGDEGQGSVGSPGSSLASWSCRPSFELGPVPATGILSPAGWGCCQFGASTGPDPGTLFDATRNRPLSGESKAGICGSDHLYGACLVQSVVAAGRQLKGDDPPLAAVGQAEALLVISPTCEG